MAFINDADTSSNTRFHSSVSWWLLEWSDNTTAKESHIFYCTHLNKLTALKLGWLPTAQAGTCDGNENVKNLLTQMPKSEVTFHAWQNNLCLFVTSWLSTITACKHSWAKQWIVTYCGVCKRLRECPFFFQSSSSQQRKNNTKDSCTISVSSIVICKQQMLYIMMLTWTGWAWKLSQSFIPLPFWFVRMCHAVYWLIA